MSNGNTPDKTTESPERKGFDMDAEMAYLNSRSPDKPKDQLFKATTGFTPASKFYSEEEVEELGDKGIAMDEAYSSDFDYNVQMAEVQSGWQQAGRAIGGAVVKGGLDVAENMGYLLDVPQWLRLGEDTEKGYTNWLSESAKEGKEEFDKSYGIYSSGLGDAGWWAQGFQSVGQSALGFAIPGAVAGKIAGRAAKFIATAAKLTAGTEKAMGSVATAFATNYLESTMMADELYDNLYQQGLKAGKTHQEANSIAAKFSNDFRVAGKIGVVTDFMMVSKLMAGKGLLTGGAEKTTKQALMAAGMQAPTEAFEEYSMGFTSKEYERLGKKALGIQGKDDSSFTGRALDYFTSDEGMTEMIFGGLGGISQSIGMEQSMKVIDKLKDKYKDPGEFVPDPKDSPEIQEQKRKKYEAEKAEFEENKKLLATGTIQQTKKEVNELMKKEGILMKQYQQAIIDNDLNAVKDIENQRFENMFLRHAAAKSVFGGEGSLDAQFEAYTKDENADAETRKRAAEFRKQLPEMEKEYNRLSKDVKNPQAMKLAFSSVARARAMNSFIEEVSEDINTTKQKMLESVGNTSGIEPSSVMADIITLQKEKQELLKLQEENYVKFNPVVQRDLNNKIANYDKLLTNLNETLKDYDTAEQVSIKAFEADVNIAELERQTKDRAQAFVTESMYRDIYKKASSSKYNKTLEESNFNHVEAMVKSAADLKALGTAQVVASTMNLSKKNIGKLADIILKQHETIAEKDKKLLKEYEDLKERVDKLNELNDKLNESKASIIAKSQKISKEIPKYNKKDLEYIDGIIGSLHPDYDNMIKDLEDLRKIEFERIALEQEFPLIHGRKKIAEYSLNKAQAELDNFESEYISPKPVQEKEIFTPEEQVVKSSAVDDIEPGGRVESGGIDGNTQGDPVDEQKEDFPTGYYKNLAYISSSLDKTAKKNPLIDWLELDTHVNKTGTKFEFEIDESDYPISNVDKVGIKMYPVDKSGNRIIIEGDEIQGWLRIADSKYKTDSEDGEAWLHTARTVIIEAHKKGRLKELKPEITDMGYGHIAVSEENKDLREVLKKEGKDISLSVHNGNEFKGTNGTTVKYGNKFGGTKGFVYARTTAANGKQFPLRLNSKKLGIQEANLLYHIISKISQKNGADINSKMEPFNETEGLTYRQAMNMLVYDGAQSLNSKNTLWLNFKEVKKDGRIYSPKTLYITNKDGKIEGIPFSNISNRKDDLVEYFKELWATTNTTGINKTFRQAKFANNFKWFGKEVGVNDNYNDFLFDNAFLSTNVESERIFVQPWVEVSNPVMWGNVGDTKTESKQEPEIADWQDTESSGVFDDSFTVSKEVKEAGEQALNDLAEFLAMEKKESVEPSAEEFDALTEIKKPVGEKVGKTNILSGFKRPTEKQAGKKKGDGESIADELLKTSLYKKGEPLVVKEEVDDVKAILPKIPIQVANGLLRVPGGLAEGTFYNGLITISDAGNKGVGYHEAFHAVSQYYLTPDERIALYKEASEIYGTTKKDGTLKTAKDYEEDLAEGFREYMLTRGRLDLPKGIKWLYDVLLDLINLFRNNHDTLFSKIRAGRFDYSPKTVKAFNTSIRLPFPSDFINDATKSITFVAFAVSKLAKYEGVSNVTNEESFWDTVFNTILDFGDKATEDGNEEIASRMWAILDDNYWESFKDLTTEEIKSYGFEIKKDETDTVDLNEDDVSGGLNIESALTRSSKSNATDNVKLMVHMLRDLETVDGTLKGVESKWFGRYMPKLVDSDKSWRLLEDALTDIVSYTDEQEADYSERKLMEAKVTELAESHVFFQPLLKNLRDPKFPEIDKVQFYKTFSKTKRDYILSNGKTITYSEGEGKDKKTWEEVKGFTGSADSQSHSRQIRNSWNDLFQGSFVGENGKLNKSKAVQMKEAVAGMKKIVSSLTPKLDLTNVQYERGITAVTKHLNAVGIEIDQNDLKQYVSEYRGDTQSDRFKAAVYGLSFIFSDNSKKKANKNVEDVLKSDYVFDSEEKNYITDNYSLLSLAGITAERKNLPGERMVVDPEGKSYFAISQNNYISKQFNRFLTSQKHVDDLMEGVYHSKSKFLEKIKSLHVLANEVGYTGKEKQDLLNSVGISVQIAHKLDDGSDAPKDITPEDDLTDRINKLLQGVTGRTSFHTPLTMGDKTVHYLLKGFGVESYELSKDSISDIAVDDMMRYMFAEIERIQYEVNRDNNITAYSGKATKGFWFPQLSYGSEFAESINLYTESGKYNSTEEVKKALEEYAKGIIRNAVKLERNNLIKHGILKTDSIVGVNENILKKYKLTKDDIRKRKTQDLNDSIYEFVGDYALNTFIGNIEYTMMFTGDPAYYKDLSKRVQAIGGTGEDMIMSYDSDGNETPVEFRLAVTTEFEQESTLYSDYVQYFKDNNLDEDILSPYARVNIDDAQGKCTPERYRDIMRMTGKWDNAKHDPIFEKLQNPETFNPEDLADIMSLVKDSKLPAGHSIKGLHHELVADKNNPRRRVPVYVKYSLMPLWRGLVKDTYNETLLDSMYNSKTDEVVAVSGVKAGAMDITDSTPLYTKGEPLDLKPITLKNFYYKIQQELDAKYEKTGRATRGSQPAKNILVNIKDKSIVYNGTTYKGDVFASMIMDVESKLSDIGRNEFEEQYSIIDGQVTAETKNKLRKKLLKQAISDQYPHNVIEQLQKPDISIDAIFQIGEKLDSELHSMVTKKTVKLKANGASFIQLSSAGFLKRTGINDLSDLKHTDFTGIIHLQDNAEGLKGPRIEEGETKSGAVYLPFKSIEQIPNIKELLAKGLTGKQLKAKLGDTIEGIIGYRIPNQGISSIDTLEIAGILPPYMGDTIVTYDDIPAKTGSDFDIDKMYVMTYHTFWDDKAGKLKRVDTTGDSKEAIENRRLELWDSVLKAPDTFTELIKPIDSNWLRDDCYFIQLLEDAGRKAVDGKLPIGMAEYFKVDTVKGLLNKEGVASEAKKYYDNIELLPIQYGLDSYQLEVKNRNMAGKAGIGQTANPLANHPLAQLSDLSLIGSIGMGHVKDGLIDLSQEKVKNDPLKRKINEVISAWLNAFVDNAKDPYISLINNNTKTTNTVMMLLRSGVQPEIVNRFMSQPLLKEFIQNKYKQEAKIFKEPFVEYSTVRINEEGVLFPTEAIGRLDPYGQLLKKYQGNPKTIKSLDMNDITESKLNEYLTEDIGLSNADSIERQLSTVRKYIELEFLANKLNDAVKACKTDTEGAYRNGAENFVAREIKRKVDDEAFVNNFNKMVEDSFIATYDKNSLYFSDEIYSKLLLSKSSSLQNTTREIFNRVGKQYVDNADIVRTINRNFKTFVLSGFTPLSYSKENKNLLKGDNTVAHKLIKAKELSEIKDNLLLNLLRYEKDVNTGLHFVTVNNLPKSQHEQDKLFLAWEELFDTGDYGFGNIEIENGYMVKDFAEDLVKLSFITSGFNKTMKSFHDMIPATYMEGVFEGENIHKYMNAKLDQFNRGNILEGFIDQFFRHNADDQAIMPTAYFHNVKNLIKLFNSKMNQGIIIKEEDLPERFTSDKAENYTQPKPYINIKTGSKKDVVNNIYKYVGVKDGSLYFTAVSELGTTTDKNNRVIEYDLYDTPSSFINKSKDGLPFDTIATLMLEYSPNVEDVGAFKSNGDGTYLIEGIKGEFVIKEKSVNKQKKYSVFLRNSYGREKEVNSDKELSNTVEEALTAANEKLNKLGKFNLEQLFNNLC